jgi:hypothetical protein
VGISTARSSAGPDLGITVAVNLAKRRMPALEHPVGRPRSEPRVYSVMEQK